MDASCPGSPRQGAVTKTHADDRARVRSHQAQPHDHPLPPPRPNRRAHRMAITDGNQQPHQAPPPPAHRRRGLKPTRRRSHRPNPAKPSTPALTAGRVTRRPRDQAQVRDARGADRRRASRRSEGGGHRQFSFHEHRARRRSGCIGSSLLVSAGDELKQQSRASALVRRRSGSHGRAPESSPSTRSLAGSLQARRSARSRYPRNAGLGLERRPIIAVRGNGD